MAAVYTTNTPQSNASLSVETTKYDAEIENMAAYVHNYQIKSALAVNIVFTVATYLNTD